MSVISTISETVKHSTYYILLPQDIIRHDRQMLPDIASIHVPGYDINKIRTGARKHAYNDSHHDR